MQASVDGQNVYWKLLDLLADNLKNSNTSPPELPSLGSWVMHVLHVSTILDRSALNGICTNFSRTASAISKFI